jgi:hypothetical protein
VVLLDLTDQEYSVGFNILTAHSNTEKTLLASDLVSVFRRLSTSWGDQMNSVLNNAILAFLESKRGGTISDLRRFLIEPAYQAEVLSTVQDSELIYYWQKGFPLLSGSKSTVNRSIGPILTRLEMFLAQKPIRYMVSQRDNRLDFGQIMDTGKIFLAKLPEGIVGKENSYLLGSLLIAKFHQLATARQEQEESLRRDFWLYIDEFPNFITPSMAQILRGVRKYRIGLTLAHQELRQLDRDSEVASAVMTNPGTRIYFGVSDEDATKLARTLSFFETQDLQNLATGQAICRVEQANQDFNLAIPNSDPIDPAAAKAIHEAAKAASRQKYSRLRAEVEAEMFVDLGIAAPKPAPDSKPTPVPQPKEVKPAEVPKPAAQSIPNVEHLDETESKESQHTIIKRNIGAEAEILDFAVTYEEHFPVIQARADIVLRRGKHTIICQVTVGTGIKYEADSIHKFLRTDCADIALISGNRKKLGLIQQTLGDLGPQAARVGFYSVAEFISKLYDLAASDPEGGKVEQGKPKKQDLNLNSGNLTEAERIENEARMLAEIKARMGR